VMQPGTAEVPAAARRARFAVMTLFGTYGMLFGTVVPRYPQLHADLHLSNARFGAALTVYAGAAVAAGPLTGVVVRRLGSARAATAAVAALAAATALIGVARTWWMLAATFTLAGLADPLIDVAVNRQSLNVQRGYGRSILAAVHATWCLGAVTGGLLGSAAAGIRLSLPLHLGAAATVGVAVVALTARQLLPDDPAARPDQPAAGPRVRPRAAVLRAVAGLGAVAAIGAVIEDATASWSGIYLTGIGAAAGAAGLGYVALQAAMTAGRLAADRAVDRWGHRRIARIGCTTAAAAMAAVLAVGSPAWTVIAFGVVGAGTATLIPAALHTVDQLPGLAPATGLTAVSWLQRGAGLLSPALVGAAADVVSLRAALVLIPTAALIALLLTGYLTTRQQPPAMR
jgi:MFS family permease